MKKAENLTRLPDGMLWDEAENSVEKLFTVTGESRAVEQEFDSRISSLIDRFLVERDVSAPRDLTEFCKTFGNSHVPEGPVKTGDYLRLLEDEIVAGANRIASPRCLGHMNPGLPYLMRPLARLVTALNQNMVKMEASRSLSLCERQVLGMLHRLAYRYPSDFYSRHLLDSESTLGIITSGGTSGNITALWCARNNGLGPDGDFEGVEREGLAKALKHYGYSGGVIIGSDLMHYSFNKAAGMLGIGENNLIRLATDQHGRIDPADLKQTILQCRERNEFILAVVGVAGSTECGSFDPIADIGKIAAEENIHFHVDAAWGGLLLFSDSYRHKLAGIEYADSITIDGHKQLYLPLGIGIVLFRNPELAISIEKRADYIIRIGSLDQGRRSLEGSRPGMALFLHAAIHLIGRKGYAKLAEKNMAIAGTMIEMINQRPDFELVTQPEFNIVLYRYIPNSLKEKAESGTLSAEDNRTIDRLNGCLQKDYRQAGHGFVSRTTSTNSRYGKTISLIVMRAVLSNPLTTEKDIASVLQEQAAIAEHLSIHSL